MSIVELGYHSKLIKDDHQSLFGEKITALLLAF